MKVLSALFSGALSLSLSTASSFASTPPQPGVFYVSGYSASGSHTDYDLARQAADAYAAEYPWSVGSVLILKPGQNLTCDAVPLPSLGNQSTTSIIGSGSSISSIVKEAGCSASAATLLHNDSPNTELSRGWYQGFTVNANHVDAAACELYGMSVTTLIDIACGNAAAHADHELEFGNTDANLAGWMDNIYIYDLQTFDTVAGGAGGILTPVWNGSSLSSVVVTNGGTSPYTQYTRAQLFGPDLVTCSTIPKISPILNAQSKISGALVVSAGNCTHTARIYILIQDGTPVTYGMKFTNMADSHVWGLTSTGAYTYGEGWLSGSSNNSIYNERPGSDQLYQITDTANGNKHIAPIFENPAGYAAEIDSQNGTIQGPLLTWSSNSYPGVSGYYLGNDPRVYQDWAIQDGNCGSKGPSNYVSITNRSGLLSPGNPLPTGVRPQSLEECNGTRTMDWPVIQ